MSGARGAVQFRLLRVSLILGAIWLVWLSLEDQGVRLLLLLTALTCTLGAAWLALTWRVSPARRWLTLLILGAAAGLAVVPLAILFMAMKTGLHGHAAPDFSPEQVSWVLSRAPAWTVAGLLAGCSAAVWELRVPEND